MSPKYDELGQVAWLWMNSSLHANWSTRMMMRNVVPPIANAQIKIIRDGDFPVAYASWAFFSDEAELRYIANPSQIKLEDWRSGERLWFIDFVSPFSARHTLKLKSQLRERFPDRYARALRVKPPSETGKVMTFFGEDAPKGWRREADAQMRSHFQTTKQHAVDVTGQGEVT